jgi:hypothetical protein
LQGLGFKLNPYNPCIANMMVDGKQYTICWYVDDNKISHVDAKVVDWVIEEIEKKFGKMTVMRGKKHVFVGINIKFTNNKCVQITMQDYVKESIEAFGEPIKGRMTSPAKNDLFEIQEDAEESNEKKSEIFHHIAAKLLYVAKRARVDIQLAIAFLCMRVSRSTVQDWEKLRCIVNVFVTEIPSANILI